MQLITGLDKISWNSFVSSFDDPAILQSHEWGELKALHGWMPIRVAVEDDGKIVAAISILKRKLPYFNLNIFYAPRGPVVDFENTEALDFLLDEVRKLAKKHRAIALKIDPQIVESRELKVESREVKIEDILKERGFSYCKKQIQPRSTFVVDLTLTEEKLLASFEEKTRYNIRLSAKKGVTVKKMSTDEGVDTFYNIYKETASRDNFLIHPIRYYRNIKKLLIGGKELLETSCSTLEKSAIGGKEQLGTSCSTLGKKATPGSNIFIAYHKDIPVAGVWTFNFGKKIWYMYGASLSSYRNVMPNHALHWHIMKWAKEKELKDYDMFGIPSNPTEKHPLWGVYRFKKGFNGKLVKYIGVYDLAYRPLLYKLIEKGISLFQNLRSLLLKGKISDSLGE